MKAFSSLRETLARPNAEILCSEIRLIAYESMSADPVVAGPGRFTFRTDGKILFEVQASLTNAQALVLHRRHLHYAWSLAKLHLYAASYNGMEYQGWIEAARLGQDDLTNTSSVRVVGRLSMLQTEVAVEMGLSCATVIYAEPPEVPLSTWRKTTSIHNEKREWFKTEKAGHTLTTEGTTVTVLLDSDTQELEVSATTGTGGYAHPYLEDFLTEPFRALNGSSQYPRYVLRNRGDGTARLRIFPRDEWKATLGGARSAFELIECEGYWAYFGKYLHYLAGQDGQEPLGGPAHLTLLHDEINRAVRGGSHWIVSLALSSAIEGLLKMHPAWSVVGSPVTDEQKSAAEQQISAVGSEFLRDKLTAALLAACRDQQPNGSRVLKALVAESVITSKHKRAWEEFRHHVTHGNLLDYHKPDRRLEYFVELYELFQILSAERINFSTSEHPLSEQSRQMLDSYKGAKHA